MAKKQDVLTFAFHRLYDEVKNDGDYQYWRAYIRIASQRTGSLEEKHWQHPLIKQSTM